MCACTCRRNSAIIFCADLESSCVSVNEVNPCRTVAARTPSTMGVSNWICRLPRTLSTRYFVEAGKTNPERRLMAINTKPSASSPRLGLISAQTSGRFFHAFLRFSLLTGDCDAVSVAMICGTNNTPGVRCRWRLYDYIAKKDRSEKLSSVACGSRARHAGPGGSLEVQDAGNELADGDSQMAPESPLQAGVILRAAEKISHQLAEHRATAEELNHARGDSASQEGATIETPHDARREFQFGAESSLHPCRILFRAAFGERAPQQFAGANGIEKAFAREGIDPGRRIPDERPVLSDDVSFGKRALLRRRQHVTVKLCALRLYALFLYECLQMAAQFRAGMRRHTAADAHRERIAARERPDISFKVRQELDGDGVADLRHKVALSHLHLVAVQGPCFGEQLIARTGRENQKIGFLPSAFHAVARLRRSGVHIHHPGTLHVATRIPRAIQEHAVEDRS